MAFQGFGKNSGPTAPPRAQTPFGNPPPSFPRSPREVEAPGGTHPPPMSFSGVRPAVPPFRPFAGVTSEARPSWGDGQNYLLQDDNARTYQRPPPVVPLIASSNPGSGQARPSWGDGQNYLLQDYNARTYQRPPPVVPLIASSNPGSGPPAKTGSVQDLKRSRSPSSLSPDEKLLRNSRTIRGSHAGLLFNDQSQAQQAQAPPFPFQENLSADGRGPSFADSQWPASSSPLRGNQLKSFSNFNNSPTQQDMPMPSNSTNVSYDSGGKSPTQHNNIQVAKRIRSPPFPSMDETSWNNSTFIRRDPKRSSVSPPKLRANGTSNIADPENFRRPPTSEGHENTKVAETKTTNFPVTKRTKIPSLPSSSFSVQDDMTRESQAKAKRLARFRDELSEPAESDPSIRSHKVAAKRQQHPIVERRKVTEESAMDTAGDLSSGNVLSEYEGLGSTNIIVGSCPDMCPESERAERERKGDLDQYERVDGDRNQTSIYLAVKKYTRTAEREAELIRPMPILQKTMDYLLNLLDQPYDDKFLGLYNFLWDRMRAIRMDLRMQHIFDQGAISMLEQMIRLHIIAMHELCEYTKGEGFSEGFDAHLNIEQMNKTSVELFQLYDDHRKKGIEVPTEKEFRGYYALLKLDKHPGYKVEPAELSLDLAKMTPDMRQTPEVLFARDVARACRTGNFIAFFRLARKASYLQACLMHAHFAKLRTQALAALHSGLQNNQGIPVTHVSRWLGMEEEDIENLMEYYGFLIKEFEEPYMVKEGTFLNVDNDYPVKCSKLAHSKKARTIVEDVLSSSLGGSYSHEVVKEHQLVKGNEQKLTPIRDIEGKGSPQANDEDMPDYETVVSPKDIVQLKPTVIETVSQQERQRPLSSPFKGDIPFIHGSPRSKPLSSPFKGGFPFVQDSPRSKPLSSPFNGDIPFVHGSPRSQLSRLASIGKPRFDIFSANSLDNEIRNDNKGETSDITSEGLDQEMVLVTPTDSAVEGSQSQHLFIEDLEDEEPRGIGEEPQVDEVGTCYYHEEVAEAKLKLILRLWKRRCSRKRELREQKQLATNAALSLLSLGPPIWQNEAKPSTFSPFNIDNAMSKRYEIRERSWSRLNVSEVIAAKLTGKNPDAKCLCWKIVVCSQEDSSCGDKLGQRKVGVHLAAGSWLLSKLMPPKSVDCYDDDGLVGSSSGLSIWTKWLPSQSGADLTCCLSVIKDAKFENLDETVVGANAVLFVLSKCLPWDLQKERLHNLLMSLPSGSHLPLLILSGSCEDNISSTTIVEGLRLHDVDESRISTVKVAFLRNRQMKQFGGFFSDDELREGLQWLASESPQQPALCCIKTRELVLSRLNASLKVSDEKNSHKVDPNQCISVFNEALEQTVRAVTAAAQANPTCWPCPEIALMDESSDEYRAAACFLPNTGWSSAANIAPLIHALNDSKLPSFADDISWLYEGSDLGNNIEDHRSKLESCLIRYLTDSSRMMGISLAMKEARVMLQTFARLELHNSTYYIVPNWGMIFQRVFNWRLMSLSAGAHSAAYVLIHDSDSTSVISDTLEVERGTPLSHHMVYPSLDEMVEVSCSSPVASMPHLQHENSQPSPGPALHGSRIPNITREVDFLDSGKDVAEDGTLFTRDDNIIDALNNRGSDSQPVKATKEADKLTELLDKCSIMQNTIDEKLAVYF